MCLIALEFGFDLTFLRCNGLLGILLNGFLLRSFVHYDSVLSVDPLIVFGLVDAHLAEAVSQR